MNILNQAFNQMSDIAILFQVVDDRFIIIKANPSAYNAGFRDEFYGEFVEDIFPPALAGPLCNLLRRAYTSKEFVRFNETLPLTSGKLLGDIALTPILDEDDNNKVTHIVASARDITESKKWEEELVQNNSFYHTILFSTTDAILVVNSERIILRLNNGFTSLFGWKEHEVIGLPLDELNFVPIEYLEEHEEITNKILHGTGIPSYRTLRKHKNGMLVPVDVSYSPLKEENGTILGSIIIYRDMTKQIKIEQQLEEEKQRYQSLVKNHPDAVFQFDTEGNFIDANYSVETVTGYNLCDLLNHSFMPLISEDSLECALNNFHAALNGETRKYEIVINNKNGERVTLDVTAVPITIDSQITGVFGIARNVTEQKMLEDELIQTKGKLESFVSNTSDAINITDLNGNVLYVNPAFQMTYGYSEDEVLDKHISLIQANKNLKVEDLVQRILFGEKLHDMEVIHRHKDGSFIDISFSLSPIRDEKGEITSVAAISRNITGKKEVQRRLEESEEKYRLITENMTDLISIMDPNMVILYASPSHKHVFGLNIEEGKPLETKFFHEDDLSKIFTCINEVVETKTQVVLEMRIWNADGHIVWLNTTLTPILDEQGNIQHIHCVSRDISERKSYESELEKMAYYDYLTGAPNRRLFMDRLEQTVEKSKLNHEDFSIFALDFDRFKWVNDNLGHHIGDELLVQFVHRVNSCIRDTDTIARLGGDEFAILIPGVSATPEVEKIAQRILKVLQEPWHISGHKFVTTSSIGICMSSCGGYDISTLMKLSDQALYKAKQSGRNNYQICFQSNEENGQIDFSDATFEHDIKRAIEHNEFYLVYQPKFHLSTKEICSIEALIRWEHPEKGLIVPDYFISRAEEMHLIEPITKWVLMQAGKEAKRWETLYGRGIPVAVNISPKHFETGTIIEDVTEAIETTGINPQNLILEITENAMINEMDCTIDAIGQLKKMGVKIAIDDFGKGFSSLSYLMKLEVDILKLDKAFVEELTSKKNASLVFSIVSLAHNLGLTVVAEGIETEQQYHVLEQYGCDIGQGYYFSKPLTGDQLEKVFLMK
ncbi:MAG TPA: PAS domain S-box protein [Ureibacillus sp.]|nr:PAS domain S-box protein [Ureibacillus sp.]